MPDFTERPKNFLHLGAVQGRIEQRTEVYMQYSDEVAQIMTQQCARSAGGVAGCAGKQVGTLLGIFYE